MNNIKKYFLTFLFLFGGLKAADQIPTVFGDQSKERSRVGNFGLEIQEEFSKVFKDGVDNPDFNALIELYKKEFNQENYNEILKINGKVKIVNEKKERENIQNALVSKLMQQVIAAVIQQGRNNQNLLNHFKNNDKNCVNFINLFKNDTQDGFKQGDKFWENVQKILFQQCKKLERVKKNVQQLPDLSAIREDSKLAVFLNGLNGQFAVLKNKIVELQKLKKYLRFGVYMTGITLMEACSVYADGNENGIARSPRGAYILYTLGITTCETGYWLWNKIRRR